MATDKPQNPHSLIKSMANNKKPYLVMALRQDMNKAYPFSRSTGDEAIIQDLKVIDAKLTKNKPLTLKERFIVQYVITQNCLHKMRHDGEEHLSLDMDVVDKFSSDEVKQAQEEQKSRHSKVLDIRDRLPKQANASGAQAPGTSTVESQLLFSAREFELVLTEFLDLYSQLMEDKQKLIDFEAEKVQLMREYHISEEQLEKLYISDSKTEELTAKQIELMKRLQVIDTKRETLVVSIRQRIDNIDRFYRDNMTLEDKLKLKAVLEQSSLGPAPQLQLQNALRLTPRPGGGKKHEEQYSYQPRPTTPTPKPL